jgi:tripartite-type tricarboxylate transporter receptor subunit TctC
MKTRPMFAIAMGIAALAIALAPTRGLAQGNWPERPVKIVVPFAPGGATDQTARVWAEKLSSAFKQQFLVENRGGGASGSIGIESVVKSPPDGYTYPYTPNASIAIVPTLRKVGFDAVKDLDPVARTGDALVGFTVHPSLGIKSFPELVDYAKKNPGKLTYGSSGIGMGNHLKLESIKNKFGIDILHIPYRGGADTLNDHLPGNIHIMNEPITLAHVKAGKLILLNIDGHVRHPDFPDVPSSKELGFIDAEIPVWFSLWAPAGTPKEIRQKLHGKMEEIAATDDMKAKMVAVNLIVPKQPMDDMRQYLIDDIARNKQVIEKNKIKVD